MYVSNIREDGKLIGVLPDGEMHFHSDGMHRDNPYRATTLYAIKVPTEGGNTLFSSQAAAYEALPEDLRHRLERAGGGLWTCPLRAVVIGEQRRRPETLVPVLAHELGHALGLHHQDCDAGPMLMLRGGCPGRGTGTVQLSPAEIEIARGIAQTGEPRMCRAGERDEE